MRRFDFDPPPMTEPDKISEGMVPYTLPRLEHLEMQLNIIQGCYPNFVGYPNADCYLAYSARPKDNTMTIVIRYSSDTPEYIIEEVRNRARKHLQSMLDKRRWDWVKIEESLSEIPNPIRDNTQ